MDVERILKTNKPIPLKGRTIIHLLLIHQSITEKTAEALKPFDVSAQQFNVLRILKGQNGKPANLSTLNDRMVSKMSNTTRLVDKLILKDFVKRTVCKENRRKIEIYITKKGEEELIKMSNAMLSMEKSLLKNINDEDLQTLNKVLDKFNTDN